MQHTLRLTPFHHHFQTDIMVYYELTASELSLCFTVSDDDTIDWSALDTPTRADYLWESTCLELFLTPVTTTATDCDTQGKRFVNKQPYIELNIAPSGQWNAYLFHHYRTPDEMPPLRASLTCESLELQVTDTCSIDTHSHQCSSRPTHTSQTHRDNSSSPYNLSRTITLNLDTVGNYLTQVMHDVAKQHSASTTLPADSPHTGHRWLANITSVITKSGDAKTEDFYAVTHATPADFHDMRYWFLLTRHRLNRIF